MDLYKTKRSRVTTLLDRGMIPMINIIFLLLVFFMIAGQISPRSPAVVLPDSISENELVEADVDIALQANGVVTLNGEAFEGRLEDRLKAMAAGEGVRLNVVLKAHRALPASALDPVLKALRSAGQSRLRIATLAAS